MYQCDHHGHGPCEGAVHVFILKADCLPRSIAPLCQRHAAMSADVCTEDGRQMSVPTSWELELCKLELVYNWVRASFRQVRHPTHHCADFAQGCCRGDVIEYYLDEDVRPFVVEEEIRPLCENHRYLADDHTDDGIVVTPQYHEEVYEPFARTFHDARAEAIRAWRRRAA